MKKLISLVMFLVMFLSFTKITYAEENHIKLGDRVPGVQVYLKTPTVERKNKNIYEITNTTTGELVYCIEPGVMLYEGDFKEYDMDHSSLKEIGINLTEEQLDVINKMAYFGYKYNASRSDIKWYAITQVAIWQYLLQDKGEVYFVNEQGKRITDYDKELALLLDDALKADMMPSFVEDFGPTWKNFAYGTTFDLTDEYHILEKCDIHVEGDFYYYINGNNLQLSFDKPGDFIISFIRISDWIKPIRIFYNSSSQTVFGRGVIYHPQASLFIHINYPDLKIVKSSSVNPNLKLKGAKYALYNASNDEFIMEKETNAEGELSFEYVRPNEEYYVVETKAPYGYELNKEKKYFYLNENTTLELQDDPIYKRIDIEKYLQNYDGTLALEPSANFEVYNSDTNEFLMSFTTNSLGKYRLELPYGNYRLKQITSTKGYLLADDVYFKIDESTKDGENIVIKNEQIVGNILIFKKDKETNLNITEEAQFKIKNLDTNTYLRNNNSLIFTTKNGLLEVNNIPYGNYELIEIKAPYGYELNQESLNFTITKKETLELNFYNELIKGSLLLYKIDYDTHKLINNEAQFKIKNIDTNEYLTINNNTIFKTNKGILKLDNIPFGNYLVEEIKSPYGYELNSNTLTFSIKNNHEVKELVFSNQKIKGSITLYKIDSYNNKLISTKAKFKIKNLDTNTYLKIHGKEVFTTENGLLKLNDIPYGNYELIEIEAPTNYYLSHKKLSFKITKNKEVIKLKYYNTPKLGSIIITKKDSYSNNIITLKAQFKIRNKSTLEYLTIDGKDIFETTDGILKIDNLYFGDYELIEVSSPLNYHLNPNPLPFTIDKDTTITLDFNNDPKMGTLLLKKLNSKTNELIKETAKFKIRNKNTLEYLTINNNDIFETKDGILRIDNLYYGDYELIEVENPLNYHLNTTPISFSINDSNNFIEIEFKNDPLVGSLYIEKRDSLTNELLPNVVFGLYNEAKELISELKTNEFGLIEVNDLPVGTYYLKELLALDDYETNDLEYQIEIKDNIKTNLVINNRHKIIVPKTGSAEFLITILISTLILGIGVIICNYGKNN